MLCKQQVAGSSPVRSIANGNKATHAGGGATPNMDSFLKGIYWGAGFMAVLIVLTPLSIGLRLWLLRRLAAGVDQFTQSLDNLAERNGIRYRRSCGLAIDEYDFEVVQREPDDGMDKDHHRRYPRVVVARGRLTNRSEHTWDEVVLEVNMYDAKRRLVRQETDCLNGVVEPHESREFEIANWVERSPKSVTVRIQDATYLPPVDEGQCKA